MKDARIILPAGRYYIGDPCYVFGDNWGRFLDTFDAGKTEFDGLKFAACHTAYGDGKFGGFPVDAGMLAMIPEAMVQANCPPDMYVELTVGADWGQMVDFAQEVVFEPSNNGVLKITSGLRFTLIDTTQDDDAHDYRYKFE